MRRARDPGMLVDCCLLQRLPLEPFGSALPFLYWRSPSVRWRAARKGPEFMEQCGKPVFGFLRGYELLRKAQESYQLFTF